jgi:hypothetical protein
VVEMDTFDELVTKGGIFAGLAKAQLLAGAREGEDDDVASGRLVET